MFKIGLVTDIGGLNDKSFNHLAFVGIQRAKSQLGVDFKVLESHQESEYVPNLQTLAAQHYDLVIAVGFLMDGAIKKVAKAFPTTNFAIIDDAPDPALPNVQGLLFKEQESGYLAGYLAALTSKTRHRLDRRRPEDPAGRPLHRRVPSPGAKAANPQVKELNDYSNSFTDKAKCKQLALNQIAQGSDVVFQVAGGCGLGALERGQGEERLGHRRRRRPGLPGRLHPDQRHQEGRRGRVRHDQAGRGRHVHRRRHHDFDAAKGATGLGAVNSAVPADVIRSSTTRRRSSSPGSITPPDTVP